MWVPDTIRYYVGQITCYVIPISEVNEHWGPERLVKLLSIAHLKIKKTLKSDSKELFHTRWKLTGSASIF